MRLAHVARRSCCLRSTAWHGRCRAQRKPRARLRQWSAEVLAASFIGSGMSRSAPAKTRVLGSCFTARESKPKRLQARADTPHPPPGGFGHAPQHNARSIMRNPLNAALSRCSARGLCGCRPHNVRYVEVHAQRAKTLAVGSGEAPQYRSPAHPLRRVRSRATVARCLQHRSHPPPPRAPF